MSDILLPTTSTQCIIHLFSAREIKWKKCSLNGFVPSNPHCGVW